ncbi:DNA topoisomerase [Phocaeicola vulgatus]|uniref:DNA topoisomerase n=1 Tax=Phocaeicola vulgatus TaxID=821 RepID=UPI001897992B|nr:DNA topoisomerase [Phocaeicola vulgatus]MDB0754655.1 DNA topoisomerase [Phocaeicola vulgatus]MDB0766279.1 DNA topoisomerase [Phocaeicola vulgatus]MDB0770682.1 DNA topoisomerase [Phocaeicola vulgatus]MDC1695963.1 DNA topoisomerase [Phocaeicola vulgatus]
MIAIVTDKPNVGREIARVLGADRKENGYMSGNGYMVTWTYGNMLSLAMPKDTGTAWVERENFPLLPPPFLTVRHVKTDTGWNPDINAVLQLKVIAGVFDACDTIVAATDASREGEMLFRYLYRFLGCRKPCLRLWISSLMDEAIAKGMENLRPCSLFDNLFLAADSRNKADWLLGVNSNYAVCKAIGFGNNSLGRVQTPVLAAISGRYRERENHIPADSWPVFVSLCKNGKIIKMRHVEDFCNRRDALELYEDCKAAGYARITAVSSRTEEIIAPALYNLTGLQKDANRYHNLTAIRVQEITQSLYEKKLISCPRTSSRLLPGDVYDMLPPVMEKLLSGKEFRQYAGMIDLAARKGVTGNQDTAEHHAIVITGIQPGELDREERLVYTLVVGRMLETFMPPCKVEYTTVEAVCAARKFRIRTYRILEAGWLGIFQRERLVAEDNDLCPVPPELFREEKLPVTGCSLIHRKSLPAAPYTDEELADYMDKTGLGTASTRTNIIRTLLERKYIRYSGKYIIPTPKGLLLYETVRGMKVADASLTSGWEAELARIEQGELTQKEFLDGVLETVNEVTGEIFRKLSEDGQPHGSI